MTPQRLDNQARRYAVLIVLLVERLEGRDEKQTMPHFWARLEDDFGAARATLLFGDAVTAALAGQAERGLPLVDAIRQAAYVVAYEEPAFDG